MLVDFFMVLLLLCNVFKMAARLDQLSSKYLDKKMAKYLKLYDDNAIIITRVGCHEHRNAPNSYKTVSLCENSLELFVKEHQFIYFLFFHECSSYGNKEISHLCNNKKCINISHLSLEPHAINTQRRPCQSMSICLGHGIYPACIF